MSIKTDFFCFPAIIFTLTRIEEISLRKNSSKFFLYCYVWLMVGFTSGTLLLVGPVQWINEWGRSMGWSHTIERVIMITIILTYVLITGWLSWYVTRKYLWQWTFTGKTVALILVTIPSAVALWIWFHPSMMTGSSNPFLNTTPEQRFVFGDFPNKERIKQLEQRNFTAVVSLLHPAVVPFEPKLIQREKNALKYSSLKFIHAPMLPWIGNNESSLNILKKLARKNEGKYYVHCYLGKDRVRVARRAIDKAGGNAVEVTETTKRSITDKQSFERGRIFRLGDSVYLTPFPTDEEYLAYVFNGQFDHVVSLLDPTKERNKQWINKESKLMERYDMNFHHWPVTMRPRYDAKQLQTVVQKTKNLSGQILVHDFLTEDKSAASEAFVMAYRLDQPPLPPSLIEEKLSGGMIRVVDVSFAVGPRPTLSETENVLPQKGFRGIVHVTSQNETKVTALERLVKQSDLKFETVSSLESFRSDANAERGPWYAFGSGISADDRRKTDRLKRILLGFETLR